MENIIVEIKRINWLDKDGLEAEVLFEVQGENFWAFCQPCDFIEGETAVANLGFIEEQILEASFWGENKEHKKEMIPSTTDRWSYYCYGQIKNIHPAVVDCGTFNFSFGDWLNDERTIGCYVYFVIARLDIGKIR